MRPEPIYNGYRPIIYNHVKIFKDPINRGFLNITASSIFSENNLTLPPENLINWDNGIKWMSNKSQNQYFIFEFKNAYYYINSYAFLTAIDHSLVQWAVHGSINGQDWTKIGEGNENICEDHMGVRDNDQVRICLEEVPRYFNVTNIGIFRYIKVTQTGRNTESDEQHNEDGFGYTFYLKGFEVYGKLYIPYMKCSCESDPISISLFIIAFIMNKL